MSEKDCGHYESGRKKILRRLFAGFLIFAVIVLLVILIIWLILKPTKPQFVLQDATVYAFNLSGTSTSPPNILTSVFQVTVQSNNPNDRIGIYYDRLNIYAVYDNEQITYPANIPPTYQDTDGANIWSPFIYGYDVPIAPYIGNRLRAEREAGGVTLLVKMDGRVRWKVGLFVSGGYGLRVRCSAFIPFGDRNLGVVVGDNGRGIKYQLVQGCSVSV